MICKHKQANLCGNIKCEICFCRSVASHKYVKYWNKEMNDGVEPHQVMCGSGINRYWGCKSCEHLIFVSPLNFLKRKLCQFCKPNGNLCGDPLCKPCFDKSLASTPYAKLIIPMPDKQSNPCLIRMQSNEYIHAHCIRCNHKTYRRVQCMITAIGCDFCTGTALCGDIECESCYVKSFAMHPRAQLWDREKNKDKPHQLRLYSHEDRYFNCDICNKSYYTRISYVSKGNWCSCVKNKTEAKCLNWFEKQKFLVKPQKRIESIKNKRYDFCIEELKLIIELDGGQHFIQVSTWKSPEFARKMDCLKMLKANLEGYSIIRILQEDVWEDRNNWESKLLAAIKQYDTPTIIYLDSNNEYDNHKLTMKNLQTLYNWHIEARDIKAKLLHKMQQTAGILDIRDYTLQIRKDQIQDHVSYLKQKLHVELSNEEYILYFMKEYLFMEVDMYCGYEYYTYNIDKENSIYYLL